MSKKVIAILCSDLHLSHTPPVARSSEPDWYGAMGRMIDELGELVDEHGDCLIVAGDIFDHWNAPAELINWAIVNLPRMYSTTGQHDLPHHNREEIKRSAYWTLVEAGIIEDIYNITGNRRGCTVSEDRIKIQAMEWGQDFPKPVEVSEGMLRVLVAHRYIWHANAKYPGASVEANASLLSDELEGYDVALFGDNHIGFSVRTKSGCLIWNNGSVINRKSDQRNYRPRVGLLMEDGTVENHYLDVSKDIWIDEEESIVEVGSEGLVAFLDGLEGLEGDSLDYTEAVHRYLEENKVSGAVRKILLDAIGG